MAACVLSQRLPRLRYLRGLRKDFTRAQHLCVKIEDESDEQDGKKGALQNQEDSLLDGYTLYYSPSSYHHSVRNPASSRSQTDGDEDEWCVSTLAPSFWQQCNRYSVSSSRRLSSSKNTLLELAFNKAPEARVPRGSPNHAEPATPDAKVDARGFYNCRPEYARTSLDLAQRPAPIEWEEALALLQKVSLLKGSMKPSDVSHFLAELSRLHPDKMSVLHGNQRFVMLLRYSLENLCLFTDAQLLDVLRSFVWLAMPFGHTVLGLYESELSRRADQMTLHQLLRAADLWRCIRKQVPQFLQHLYDSVHLHLGQMGVPETVQLAYIMGEGRHLPAGLVSPVKQLLLHHLPQLYPEEVGIVCLGLFKSQTVLTQSAVTSIVDKAHSFVTEMSDFAVVNVLKLLRFSYQYHRAWMNAMSQEIPRRAPRMGVQGLMHVALACSALHYRNDDILAAIADRVPSLAPHCRSKDSGKLLWAFGSFMFQPVESPGFYPSLIEALRQRQAEFQRYPEHLLTGLMGLAFVSQFPEDLIALALSPEFVNLAVKSNKLELKKDLFTLDGAVALELPHWTGPRLSRELREETTEMLWKFAQSDLCRKPEVLEAEAALQDLLGGERFVCKRMILPHTRFLDLEVHLDSRGQPIPVNPATHTDTIPENTSPTYTANQGWGNDDTGVTITEELLAQLVNAKSAPEPSMPAPKSACFQGKRTVKARSFDTGLCLTSDLIETLTHCSGPVSAPPDADGTVKLAILLSGRNHYCCDSKRLLGLPSMKRRHLKLAGYRVVELCRHEWVPMVRKSRAEKLGYLHCKVYDSL